MFLGLVRRVFHILGRRDSCSSSHGGRDSARIEDSRLFRLRALNVFAVKCFTWLKRVAGPDFLTSLPLVFPIT